MTSEADAGDASAGYTAPTTVVLQGREALVIDPGPTRRHGERLRRAVACRFGAQVRWIVNTHAHAENVLANAAFADRVREGRTSILATAGTRQRMVERCADCLASLAERLGHTELEGTTIVLPTETVRPGDVLRIGRWRLEVIEVPNAHTESDLVLWDRSWRTLWAGGLVYSARIPELAQGSLGGWLGALERLRALRPRQVIAVTGSVARGALGLRALEETERYLLALRSAVRAALEAGAQADELDLMRDLAPFVHPGDAERHAFNVQRAWRELEVEWFEQAPSGEQTRR